MQEDDIAFPCSEVTPSTAFALDTRHSITNLVVVGASVGGVPVLKGLLTALPPDLPAAVLVVVHVPASVPSHLTEILPEILDSASSLPVARAQDGEIIEPGRICVAPADRHLLVQKDGRIQLSHGPHHNQSRPAIDPLFLSAARAFGRRVVGVLLSADLFYGSRGLAAVKEHGGVTLVQSPQEALVEGKPVKEIVARLAQLVAVGTVVEEEAVTETGMKPSNVCGRSS